MFVAFVVALAGMPAYAEGQIEEPAAGAVRVVATTTIVGDIVSRIGGDRLSVYVMLPPGADPHAFQATPRDARQVADAAVVFINGAGLEADFLGDLVANTAGRVVDLTAHLELRSAGDEDADEHEHDEEDEHDEDADEHEHDEEDEHDEDADEHEHGEEDEHDEDADEHEHDEEDEHDEDADEHEHDEEDEHEHGEHEHGEFDPHVWMDPTLVAAWTVEIAEALGEVDPEHGADYARRAAELADELNELDVWVRDRVAAVPADRRIMVTDHDVFGYFAARYGFTVLDTVIPGFSTVAEPSARHLAALREAIAEHGVPAIFVGLTVDAQVARAVAGDLGIDVVSVYTGSLSDAAGPAATYSDFIRTNVERIVSALEDA